MSTQIKYTDHSPVMSSAKETWVASFTSAPEHFTASLVGHHTAGSVNKLTSALYSAGINDAQKRGIIDRIRVPVVEG